MTIDDVVGLGPVKEEVVKTLNLFLAYQTFRDADGWQPAQGDPLRGPAGNGQDVHGEGHGARGRRAVPVRLLHRVPVDVLRPDRSQDPQLLQGAAQGRARRGRRDRVHRGDRRDRGCPQWDARHSPVPSGLDEAVSMAIEPSGVSEGISGVVNELLIQLQSFDQPTFGQRFRGVFVDMANRWLPGAPADSEEAAARVEHLGDRRDEPRRRPRSRDAPPGSLRPVDPLRSAEPLRPARDRRLLPRPQGARARARQGRAPRPARRDDHRLHAGDDRAPVRRRHSCGRCATDATRWTGTTCSRRSSPRRSGSSSRSSTRSRRSCTIAIHEAGPRGRRAPRRSRPQARGAVDHQAPRCARIARALRQGRALDEDPDRAHRLDQDRVRRHDRGGAVLR